VSPSLFQSSGSVMGDSKTEGSVPGLNDEAGVFEGAGRRHPGDGLRWPERLDDLK